VRSEGATVRGRPHHGACRLAASNGVDRRRTCKSPTSWSADHDTAHVPEPPVNDEVAAALDLLAKYFKHRPRTAVLRELNPS
jgi:hypothetical protein